jgi:hypothetical protein
LSKKNKKQKQSKHEDSIYEIAQEIKDQSQLEKVFPQSQLESVNNPSKKLKIKHQNEEATNKSEEKNVSVNIKELSESQTSMVVVKKPNRKKKTNKSIQRNTNDLKQNPAILTTRDSLNQQPEQLKIIAFDQANLKPIVKLVKLENELSNKNIESGTNNIKTEQITSESTRGIVNEEPNEKQKNKRGRKKKAQLTNEDLVESEDQTSTTKVKSKDVIMNIQSKESVIREMPILVKATPIAHTPARSISRFESLQSTIKKTVKPRVPLTRRQAAAAAAAAVVAIAGASASNTNSVSASGIKSTNTLLSLTKKSGRFVKNMARSINDNIKTGMARKLSIHGSVHKKVS